MSEDLWIRSAGAMDVSFPARTIDLIVLPYEEMALVEHQGRMVEEIVTRGAFDGIERRPNRVKVNRDHDVTRTCGRTVKFDPASEVGLVAEIKIANTPLGQETLELAADGILDASAGFLPLPNGQTWETRSRRRLNKLWLGHIAMTPDPAYEGAQTLAVRDTDAPVAGGRIQTPNLDQILAARRSEEYSRLSH